MNTPSGRRQAPDCNRCAGFYITHEPAMPYGCRFMAFRSRQLPCRVVEAASGMPCLRFQARDGGRVKPGG
ncbi:MAG: hypothetical protein ACK4KV_09010 [Rhodocyclaceae bacterium]